MSILIRIKRSSVSGDIPDVLMHGELAVNIPDQKMWIGGLNNLPIEIPILGPTGSQGIQGVTGPTGADGGVSSIIAGTGISVSSPTGAVTVTNIGALLTANTFTGLQTFNAGISASVGVTFSSSIITTGYQVSSGAINAQTASYQLVASDNGKIITMNVGSANNLTVPAGFNCTIIQIGTGQTTLVASSTTLNSYQDFLKISGRHGSASIVSYVADTYNIAGSLSE